MDLLKNWQLILTIATTLISIGGLVYMIKDHGKRLVKLEEWRDKVVDEKLGSIQITLNTFTAVTDEKLKNILLKIEEICSFKKIK